MKENKPSNKNLACVASVSVGLGAKKDRGTGFSAFFPREKWGESQKTKEGVGEGREGTACRQTLWILKTSVRQQTELAIGWDSRILLTCVDQRTQTCEAFEGCLQKALISSHRTKVD